MRVTSPPIRPVCMVFAMSSVLVGADQRITTGQPPGASSFSFNSTLSPSWASSLSLVSPSSQAGGTLKKDKRIVSRVSADMRRTTGSPSPFFQSSACGVGVLRPLCHDPLLLLLLLWLLLWLLLFSPWARECAWCPHLLGFFAPPPSASPSFFLSRLFLFPPEGPGAPADGATGGAATTAFGVALPQAGADGALPSEEAGGGDQAGAFAFNDLSIKPDFESAVCSGARGAAAAAGFFSATAAAVFFSVVAVF
mmetsp:Transcript_6430/g.13479  ORF Transcript_6430/g.13479 Transcript_6430/m.13479 type:complete len:252 (-) Transcript_6430:187-942(-)